MGRLLVAARERSLAEAAVNKGGRTRKDGTRPAASVAKLSDEARADRIRSGRGRELVYRMSALTGLRRGELGALVACDLSLTDCPMVRIPAFDPHTRERLVKNGQAVILPLVPSLSADLASWVADTDKQPGDRVLNVPTLKTFKADMRHAGIPYEDTRGGTADFHSLRRSTARCGLPPGKWSRSEGRFGSCARSDSAGGRAPARSAGGRGWGTPHRTRRGLPGPLPGSRTAHPAPAPA